MKMTPEEICRTRKQFFNDSAESWLDTWYKDPETGRLDRHQKDFDRLFAIVPLNPGDRVLDAGCGSGVLVPMVLQRITGKGMLYELDFAEKMIETNRSLHNEENIRFIIADAAEAPLDAESCDVVLCFSCFPHFHDKERTMLTLSRILKRGGTFVVAHFESSEGINKHHESCHAVMHDHLPHESEMRDLFQRNALRIEMFIDEPGFYCVLGKQDFICGLAASALASRSA
jgi:ubiquinone/menaquinone biosynthesis C-methylase UbiE